MAGTASTTSTRTKATKTKPAKNQETTAVAESAATAVADVADNDTGKEVKNTNAGEMIKETNVDEMPLDDSDEIEVVALISHVSYKDPYTSDFYRWDEAGQVELMPYESLIRMRRNYRSYFDNMWLKPNDERVIKKFGLGRLYANNDFLMDEASYTSDNIDDVIDAIREVKSNNAKNAIINKIKDMVASGQITNINVIRSIEKSFDIDLVSSL